MPARIKHPTMTAAEMAAEVFAIYQVLGSIDGLAELWGVHRNRPWRLMKAYGYEIGQAWSQSETDAIKAAYAVANGAPLDLRNLSKELGRSRAAVACKANELGLTDKNRPASDEVKSALSARTIKLWNTKPHPKGMLGKRHSEEGKEKFAEGMRRRWEEARATGTVWMSEQNRQLRSDRMSERQRADPRLRTGYSRGAMGRRPDLNDMHFRSSWEANYARYLNRMKAMGLVYRWEFEPDTFWFLEIKRGVRSYLPDFKVWATADSDPHYVEVKGWMDAKSATKLKRMKKYHPTVDVRLVDQSAYKLLDGQFRDVIPGWEGQGRRRLAKSEVKPEGDAPGWLGQG